MLRSDLNGQQTFSENVLHQSKLIFACQKHLLGAVTFVCVTSKKNYILPNLTVPYYIFYSYNCFLLLTALLMKSA